MKSIQSTPNVIFKFDGNRYSVPTDTLKKKLWEMGMRQIDFARLVDRRRAHVNNLLNGKGKSSAMTIAILLIGELNKICKGDPIEMKNRIGQIMARAKWDPQFIRDNYSLINKILKKDRADSC